MLAIFFSASEYAYNMLRFFRNFSLNMLIVVMLIKKKCNVKFCYMDTDSFIMNIKTKDFYKDIANDVEKRFDTSNYEVDRPLSTGKNN